MILSPRTKPQSPQTRSPDANSSTIWGGETRQSGHISRMFKFGWNGWLAAGSFCWGSRKGKGMVVAMAAAKGKNKNTRSCDNEQS